MMAGQRMACVSDKASLLTPGGGVWARKNDSPTGLDPSDALLGGLKPAEEMGGIESIKRAPCIEFLGIFYQGPHFVNI